MSPSSRRPGVARRLSLQTNGGRGEPGGMRREPPKNVPRHLSAQITRIYNVC
jgi:hypothetical protein